MHAATVIVAALSARQLAESARGAGWRVVALDVFGDHDTRVAAHAWWPVGASHAGGAAAPAIDPARFLSALAAAIAECPASAPAIGWIAGAGFEARPALLDEATHQLPLLGMGMAASAALRDPRRFHALAEALGLSRPETRFTAPTDLDGWLQKDMASSGGQGVSRGSLRVAALVAGSTPARAAVESAISMAAPIARPGAGGSCAPPAAPDVAAPHINVPEVAAHSTTRYWQREQPGLPIGCLVLAGARGWQLLGVHRQLIDSTPELPYRFAGVVGPWPLTPRQTTTLHAALDRLPALGLRGLASVDWLLNGETWWLLEVNPRPSASLARHEALLRRRFPAGLLPSHVDACMGTPAVTGVNTAGMANCAGTACRAVAAGPTRAAAAATEAATATATTAAAAAAATSMGPSVPPLQVDPDDPGCSGELVIYAPAPLSIDAAVLARWVAAGDLHDLPAEPLDLPAGAPLLSVSATGASCDQVLQCLRQRQVELLRQVGDRCHAEDGLSAAGAPPASRAGAIPDPRGQRAAAPFNS